jgi:hypothetical protein
MHDDSRVPQRSDCRLKSFLEENLSTITIIGVFGALSFFSINDTDQDIQIISVLLSIIVVFLFLYVLYDGITRIWCNLKRNFGSANFIEYVKQSKDSFCLIIFLTILSLFIWLFTSYLNTHTMLDFRILLILIIFCLDVVISAIIVPYLLFKEKQIVYILALWIITSLLIGGGWIVMGQINPNFMSNYHHTPNDVISLDGFILFLLIVPMVVWITTFIKMGYLILLNKEEL